MNRIWDSKLVTPSSASIIEDIYVVLKPFQIFYRANGAVFEGLAGRSGHRCKEVGEGGIVSWGGARTKVEVCECELTKKMLSHNDLLQLCLKKT